MAKRSRTRTARKGTRRTPRPLPQAAPTGVGGKSKTVRIPRKPRRKAGKR